MHAQLLEEMRRVGIDCRDDVPADGTIVRFANGGRGKKNCWAWVVERAGKLYGKFGDWREGLTVTVGDLTPEFVPVMAQREEERKQKAIAAARTAATLWAESQPHGNSPYLRKKGVGAWGIRFNGPEILVPMRDNEDALRGLQRILPDGEKKFVYGQDHRGCYHVLPNQEQTPRRVIVCEGYATAATIREVTCTTVVCAFNVGNLHPVIGRIRQRWPDSALVIAGDNDHQTVCLKHQKMGVTRPVSPWRTRPSWCRCNPGVTEANHLQAAHGGLVWLPPVMEGGTDWNDYASIRGKDAMFDAWLARVDR